MKRLLVITGALLLAVGCAPKESEAKRECQLEAIDLAACNRSGLSAVKAEGIWNVKITLPDSTTSTAWSFLPESRLLFGAPLTEQRVEGETFFLASDFQDARGQPVRFAIAGCEASTPERVTGQFRRCVNGEADLKGVFDAAHITWQAGEQEASGVEWVGEAPVPRGTPVDVFVADGHAYVSALEGGFYVYDVSNPAAPRKVAGVEPQDDQWFQTWVKDKTLYVASLKEGVILYDVTTPSAPKRLSALPLRVEARSLFIDAQNRLYVAAPRPRGDVLIYDVTSPTQPTLLSRYVVQDSLPDAGEVPVGAVAHGGRLFIGHWAYGLAVADVSSPDNVKPLGRFEYPGATSRSVVVGDIGQRTLAFESGESWGAHMRVLDVSDPAHITQVGEFVLRPESTISGLALVGTKLYVAHNQDGLRILDVSNPSEPHQVAYFNTWREMDPGRGRFFLDGLSSVRVPGDGYIYTTETSRGLLILHEPG